MLHHLMIGMPGEAREEHRLDGHVRCRRDEIVSIHQDISEHLDRKEAQVNHVEENFGRFKKCTCISSVPGGICAATFGLGGLVVHLAPLKAFDLHSKRCAFDHLSKFILSPENCVLNEPACPRHPELQDEGLAFERKGLL